MIRELIYKIFEEHPEEQGLKYHEHLLKVLYVSLSLYAVSVVSLVHAFIPGLFINITSNQILKLSEYLQHGRR